MTISVMAKKVTMAVYIITKPSIITPQSLNGRFRRSHCKRCGEETPTRLVNKGSGEVIVSSFGEVGAGAHHRREPFVA